MDFLFLTAKTNKTYSSQFLPSHFAGYFPSRSFKHKGPNNSTIFNRWIDASVLEVITSRKLHYVLRSYKHEAFQKANYKLDLIEQPYLDKIHSR